MKAKMPLGHAIPPAAEYLCEVCENRFYFNKSSDLVCPRCGTANATRMVPVYLENDPAEDQMYTDDDWGQGD